MMERMNRKCLETERKKNIKKGKGKVVKVLD